MKPIPLRAETEAIALRVVWFELPMASATHDDMQALRGSVSDDDFREALDKALIDARSWAHWNSKIGRYRAPPLPRRTFGRSASAVHLAHQRRPTVDDRQDRIRSLRLHAEHHP